MKLKDILPQPAGTDASPDQVAQDLLDAGLDLEELQKEQKRIKAAAHQQRNLESHYKHREKRKAKGIARRKEALKQTMEFAGIDDAFVSEAIDRCGKAIEARPYDQNPPSPAAIANIAYHMKDKANIGKADGEITPEEIAERWLSSNVRQRVTIRSHESQGPREASLYH